MNLLDYTDRRFIRHLEARDKYDAIAELAGLFKGYGVCSDIDRLIIALKEREEIMATGIGFGIAVPHARIKEVQRLSFAVGVSRQGIDFEAMDKKPAHLIILVAAGEMQHMAYLRLLSRILNLLKKETAKEQIMAATDVDQIIDIIKSN